MRVVRALFWIVTVSLLLAGGNGFSARYADGPGAQYVNEDSPAYHSAQRVVASVQQLGGWCAEGNESRARLCTTAAATGHLLLNGVDRLMATFISLEIFAAGDGTDRLALDSVAPSATPPYDEGPASFTDDLQNLLYTNSEELEDIG